MAIKEIKRSPFFYVGDKYKLMPQLKELMPQDIDTYIEPFVGGGSSVINSKAKHYIVNDIDEYVISLHKALGSYADREDELFELLYKQIDKYGLSCSYRGINVPDELKQTYVKTYYSRYNKQQYLRMRSDFNDNQTDMILLYLLLIYGFNHMIRFNSSGVFNLPVGNVDFNKNVHNALCSYLEFVRENDITFKNMDYQDFLNSLDISENSYVFLDPPYLISMSEYNKLWNREKEKDLCVFLDELDLKGVHFGITNLIQHKGKFNDTFFEWSKKYRVFDIKSNYISFNDNTIKESSKEVFVTNYDTTKKV